ncbi:MAG: FAD:protein FMN transferase [bacterium]|nr:FAD:protein FMN transferase [bacterium]
MCRYAVLAIAALTIVLGCQSAKDKFPAETRTVFGVPVTVTFFIADAKPEEVKAGFDAAFKTLETYERNVATPGATNQLEKIAAGAGRESVPVDTTVYALIMRGLQLNELTGQAFDLRYGPLLDAWTKAGNGTPPQADVDSALALIKTGGMFVAGKSILLSKPNMRFDARGFVDAWAIDRAAEVLNAKGFAAFEIRTPYAVRIVGMPVNQQSREIKLGNPQTADSSWAKLDMAQGGMAYVPARGGSGRLVLDPRTGQMASGAAIAMAKDCATAFGLAYAIAVDGDAAKLTDKGRAELLGHIRISGSGPTYQVAADGGLKDRFKTLN